VGITIAQDRLRLVLERAVTLAESSEPLPEEWLDKVKRISASPSQSYVAALGTALLAKAADDRIDALTVKASAGPRAYSMRGVARILVDRASHYGYHLGVTRGEPLNNQPWFRIKRVDEPVAIKPNAKPFHTDMVRYLKDLNALSSEEALLALAAFIRLRQEFAAASQAAHVSMAAVGTVDLRDVISIAEHFIRDDPEGGRRGQALVAAVLDLLHEDVSLAAINDPTPLDVRVLRKKQTVLGVEVKQKAVTESEAVELAEGAAGEGADKALLVALSDAQGPLDHERIMRDGPRGVLTVAYDSVTSLITEAAIHSKLTAAEFAAELPGAYLRRMQEHGVSAAGQTQWVDLCEQLTA